MVTLRLKNLIALFWHLSHVILLPRKRVKSPPTVNSKRKNTLCHFKFAILASKMLQLCRNVLFKVGSNFLRLDELRDEKPPNCASPHLAADGKNEVFKVELFKVGRVSFGGVE